MRQTATVGGTTTRFAADAVSNEIVALLDSAGAVVSSFVRDAAGALVAMVRSGAVLTYLTNAHGDVTALVDAAGAVVARWTYDAWGNPTEYNAAGTPVPVGTAGNPFLFAGYFFDVATGLYYLRARYYDPATGRFLSMDPEPGRTTDRLSQNPYIYCQNDPVNLADPDGRAVVQGTGVGPRLNAWQQIQLVALRAKKAAEAARKAAAARLAAAKKAAAAKLAAGRKAAAGGQRSTGFATRHVGAAPSKVEFKASHGALEASGTKGGLIGAGTGTGGQLTCHGLPTNTDWTRQPTAKEYFTGTVVAATVILGAWAAPGVLATVGQGIMAVKELGSVISWAWRAKSLVPFSVWLTGNGWVASTVAADAADGDSDGVELYQAAARLPRDEAASRRPTPAPKPYNRSSTVIGPNAGQNLRLQSDITYLESEGATNILTNQQQVNLFGECVGINRPDLQYTLNGVRYYVEYETQAANLYQHAPRILANDPLGQFESFVVR